MTYSTSSSLAQLASAPDTPPAQGAYSKPSSGLYCILYPEGRLVGNRKGQACCFESRHAALDFLKVHTELGSAFRVQEVYLKGEVHGWEKVPPESVDSRSLKEIDL